MTPEERGARTLAKYARYRANEKGRARTRRYNAGVSGRATAARYRNSVKGLFTRIFWTVRANAIAKKDQLAALDAELAVLASEFNPRSVCCGRRRSPLTP